MAFGSECRMSEVEIKALILPVPPTDDKTYTQKLHCWLLKAFTDSELLQLTKARRLENS